MPLLGTGNPAAGFHKHQGTFCLGNGHRADFGAIPAQTRGAQRLLKGLEVAWGDLVSLLFFPLPAREYVL